MPDLIIAASTAREITESKHQELIAYYKETNEFKHIMLAIDAAARRGESSVAFKYRAIFKDDIDRLACELILKDLGYKTSNGLEYSIYWYSHE